MRGVLTQCNRNSAFERFGSGMHGRETIKYETDINRDEEYGDDDDENHDENIVTEFAIKQTTRASGIDISILINRTWRYIWGIETIRLDDGPEEEKGVGGVEKARGGCTFLPGYSVCTT